MFEELELEIPQGVTCEINNKEIVVSGKNGTVKKHITTNAVDVVMEGSKLKFNMINDRKKIKSESNTIYAIIKNMIAGVQKKYTYKLAVVYSHFPMSLAVKGKEFHINNFSGEKKVKVIAIPDCVEVIVKGKEVLVKSADKAEAGRIAGLIEKSAVVKNRDRRIYQDGIYITEKGVQNE